MKIYTKLLIIIFSIALGFQSNAQSGSIKGNITDKSGKIIEFATVTLLKSKDSTLVKGAVADANGFFEIEKIKDGAYLLGISQVGFAKYYSPIFNISADTPTINFKQIQLDELSKSLNEVQV